jgi:hypothetical protein
MANQGFEEVRKLLDNLGQYIFRGAQVDISNASDKIAEQARESIASGKTTSGASMAPLSKATLEGPVRRDGHPTPRNFYGATPMNATGKTANSIVSKKSGYNEWEIASNTDLGDAILYSLSLIHI